MRTFLVRTLLVITPLAPPLAFVTSLAPAPPAAAQESARGPRGNGVGLSFGEVRLTPEQSAELRDLARSRRAARWALRTAIHTANEDLGAYLRGGGADASEVEKRVAAVASAVKASKTEQANAYIAASALLTEEQKALVKSGTGEPTRGFGRRGGRGGRGFGPGEGGFGPGRCFDQSVQK